MHALLAKSKTGDAAILRHSGRIGAPETDLFRVDGQLYLQTKHAPIRTEEGKEIDADVKEKMGIKKATG